MRRLIITGIVVAAFGAFIVVFPGLTIRPEGTASFGPIHSTVHEQHTVLALIGWVAINARTVCCWWSPAVVGSDTASGHATAGMLGRTPLSTPAPTPPPRRSVYRTTCRSSVPRASGTRDRAGRAPSPASP